MYDTCFSKAKKMPCKTSFQAKKMPQMHKLNGSWFLIFYTIKYRKSCIINIKTIYLKFEKNLVNTSQNAKHGLF